MGWLFCQPTRETLVNHLLTTHGEHLDLVDHSRNGNHLWCLYRTHNLDENYNFIVLFLMQGSPGNTGHGDSYRWGYKDIGESGGPYCYTCPKRILNASTCSNPTAVKWRQECREYHARELKRKKFVKGLKPGDQFLYDGRKITFVSAMNRRGLVHGVSDAGHFAYRKSRIIPVGGF